MLVREPNPVLIRWISASIIAATIAFAGHSALAQDKKVDTENRLKSVQSEIDKSESQRKQYEKDVASLSRQQRALQKQLVEAAATARAHEDEIAGLEVDLVDLREREAVAADDLEMKTAHLAVSLGAMQKLSRQPTVALILRPASIEDRARSAILLDSVMPALRDQAAALRDQVSVVQALRLSIEEKQAALQAEQENLAQERLRIDKLLVDKKAQQKQLTAAIKREQARLAELAQEAQTLEALLEKLNVSTPTDGSIREEFSEVGRPIDGLPFS
ncbi:MAG: hypothetical protein O2910_06600, partial [Proteobacteria bacterium]|nr:hypothetical protein [Pseudomonadota bacterium]